MTMIDISVFPHGENQLDHLTQKKKIPETTKGKKC